MQKINQNEQIEDKREECFCPECGHTEMKEGVCPECGASLECVEHDDNNDEEKYSEGEMQKVKED